ncbi:MAG: carboxypeptidase-like regulatory domain-containing protein, partial [Bacteroidales bacterium]|nr:carboxypeptidase-like regulatory domain-containing protein [Bacteroidales bacterium]
MLLGSIQQLNASLPESRLLLQEDGKVSGTVTDAVGTVPGVTLIEKENPTNGTATDLNGRFTLNIPVGSTLVVSAIGYKTQEIAITD